MPETKQAYVLTQRHQLIDLNKSYKNFKLQFQVIGNEPNKDFHALVLNQEQLDGIEDLNTLTMKVAKGKIGGTIVADNDKYQNYFLILKSIQENENPEVQVILNIEEIEPKASTPTEQQSSPQKNTNQEGLTGNNQLDQPASIPVITQKRPLWRNPWVWLLMFVLLAGGLYYYFYIYKRNTSLVFRAETAIPVVADGPKQIQPVTNVQVEAQSEDTGPVKSKTSGNTKNQLYRNLTEIA